MLVNFLFELEQQCERVLTRNRYAALVITYASEAAGVELIAIVDAYVQIQRVLYANTTEPIRDAARAIETGATKLGSAGEAIRASAGTFEHAGDVTSARVRRSARSATRS